MEYLQSLGASVVEVSLPEMEEVKIAHVICILSEMRDMLQPDFNKHFQEMVRSSSLDQWQELPWLMQNKGLVAVRNLGLSCFFYDNPPVR